MRKNLRFLQFLRDDRDELAQLAAVAELDHAADLGEQGVIFAATDVQPRLYAGARRGGAPGVQRPRHRLRARARTLPREQRAGGWADRARARGGRAARARRRLAPGRR